MVTSRHSVQTRWNSHYMLLHHSLSFELLRILPHRSARAALILPHRAPRAPGAQRAYFPTAARARRGSFPTARRARPPARKGTAADRMLGSRP